MLRPRLLSRRTDCLRSCHCPDSAVWLAAPGGPAIPALAHLRLGNADLDALHQFDHVVLFGVFGSKLSATSQQVFA